MARGITCSAAHSTLTCTVPYPTAKFALVHPIICNVARRTPTCSTPERFCAGSTAHQPVRSSQAHSWQGRAATTLQFVDGNCSWTRWARPSNGGGRLLCSVWIAVQGPSSIFLQLRSSTSMFLAIQRTTRSPTYQAALLMLRCQTTCSSSNQMCRCCGPSRQ